VALALVAVAILVYEVVLTRWFAARLVEQGRSPREAWSRLPRSPVLWVAVILVVSAVSPAAGAVLFGIAFLVGSVFVIVLVVRGVRGLPEFARQVRRIGDPDAWRGIERD
jgi:hypothetical protein